MKVTKAVLLVKLLPFDPFDLTIRVESAEEARALYAIFNHSQICALLPRDSATPEGCWNKGDQIRTAIGMEFYVPSFSSDVISNGITGEEFFSGKKNLRW